MNLNTYKCLLMVIDNGLDTDEASIQIQTGGYRVKVAGTERIVKYLTIILNQIYF